MSQIGLIFFDDYTDPVVTKGQWIQIGGEWGITDRGYGVIEFNRTGDTEVLANTDRLYNFIFEVEFELIKETIGFLLRTSYDAKSGYMIQFFKNGLIRRHVKEDGGYPKERIQDIRPKESISSKDGTYFAKFILRENCIETAITSGDVKIEDEWLDDTYKGGKVGFRFSGTGEENGLIKKVRVYKI